MRMDNIKKCIIEGCECNADPGRRYCHAHFLQRKSEQRKARKAKGLKVRTTYDVSCIICGATFKSTRKSGKYCSTCFSKLNKFTISSGAYVYNKGKYKEGLLTHKAIATKVLGRPLSTNEVVHHMDGNKENNSISNLIVLSRSKHVALHRFLNMQGALMQGCINGNSENCWNSLIVPMTTTWLETTNVKVIKLWEIGQSAAEPLSNEEGSETMHAASRTDDDIVQTTT